MMLRGVFSRPGFTALELILVMSIFVLTAGVTLPFLGTFRTTETLETHSQEIVQTLRRAQHKAITGQRNSDWGVRFTSGEFTLFAGSSYASRNTAFDEAHEIATVYTFSGSGELAFQRISGAPSAEGAVTITHSVAGSDMITVSPGGGISLQ
jgi:Tfp pilus assembly protein FimT